MKHGLRSTDTLCRTDLEQGRMRVRDVMTHRFALADYERAIATFGDPGSGAIKIIVAP